MFIVHVFVQVKDDHIEAFKAATMENAGHSVLEPGIVRFDVIQEDNAPNHFMLVEVYRTPDDTTRHKETAHYLKWRDTVKSMIAKPTQLTKYSNIFPDDNGWG
ncbi:MAG: antibiotic biosynthesis monooxygenase [Deltaproteobacteria bacterium]|nr:antibiotic biosynthesis monooxygenase [Deltaproteobacteria bacterium]MBF0524294.1 antibiotic biosynthesis monooxygenase [Deltaproteobacteria bacterium]